MTLPRILRNSLAALALASCAPAYAQEAPEGCMERNAAIKKLEENGAQMAAAGLGNSAVLQVWVFPSGVWWIVIDNALWLCIAANGTDWRTFPTGEAT